VIDGIFLDAAQAEVQLQKNCDIYHGSFIISFHNWILLFNRSNRLTVNWTQRLQNRRFSCWAGYMQVPNQFRGADRAVINHWLFLSLSALRSTRTSVQWIPGPLTPTDKTGGAWSCQHTIIYSRDLKKKREVMIDVILVRQTSWSRTQCTVLILQTTIF
jgi:hypothetical protein